MSRTRLPQSALKSLLTAAFALIVTGGFVLAFSPPSHVATIPEPSVSPTKAVAQAAPTGASTVAPAVAGAATQAPAANTAAKAQAAAQPASATQSTAPQATPAAPTVTLVVKAGGDHTFHMSPADACALLSTARAQGKLSSLTITDRYLAQYQSLYVEEINSFRNNWVYLINGKSAPYGCTHPKAPAIKAGDTITWKQS